MGITTEELFKNVYNILFSPAEFFENENHNISLRLAGGIVVVMAVLNKIMLSIADKSITELRFSLTLIFSTISAVLMWCFISLMIEYVAKIFNNGGNLQKLLYFTAFSSIPAIFFAPLSILKHLGEIGYITSVFISCILYIWIIVLFAFAIKSAYKITLARSFMLIFLPVISSILAIYQVVGFYSKMLYIFSI